MYPYSLKKSSGIDFLSLLFIKEIKFSPNNKYVSFRVVNLTIKNVTAPCFNVIYLVGMNVRKWETSTAFCFFGIKLDIFVFIYSCIIVLICYIFSFQISVNFFNAFSA